MAAWAEAFGLVVPGHVWLAIQTTSMRNVCLPSAANLAASNAV